MICEVEIVLAQWIFYPLSTHISERPCMLLPMRPSILGTMIGPSAKRTTVGAWPAATCARNDDTSRHAVSSPRNNWVSIDPASFCYCLYNYFLLQEGHVPLSILYLQDNLIQHSAYKGLHPRKTEITLCYVDFKHKNMKPSRKPQNSDALKNPAKRYPAYDH